MEVNDVVHTGEPIVSSGSSSDVASFDELEALTETRPKKTESNTQSKSKKASSEQDEDQVDDQNDSDDSENDKLRKEKVEKKTDEQKAKDGLKPKALKFKSGDNTLELPTDAKITIPVNGKNEEFSVQDLVNEFSGKTHWNRKYQELDTDKKTFHAERQALQTSIDDLYDLAVTKNEPMGAIAMLVDLLGGTGNDVVQKMRDEMERQISEYASLSDEEKRLRKVEEENQLYKSQLKRRQDTDAKRSNEAKFAKRVEDVKTKYNISESEFSEVYNTLKNGGKMNPEELTPETVAEVHQAWKRMDSVDEVVAELSFDTELAKKAATMLNAEWKKEPSLTKEDITNLAKQVFGSGRKASSNLSKKIERSGFTPKANTDKPRNEPITFDDL